MNTTYTPQFPSFLKLLDDFLDLNRSTFQNVPYLMPQDLLNSNPEKILEKNMDLFIQNSHRTLNYIENIFLILERSYMGLSQGSIIPSQEGTLLKSAKKEIRKAMHAKEQAIHTSSKKNRKSSSNKNNNKELKVPI